MPAAALRPSAIAHTMRDWPRCMSPAVNTPSTLVIQFPSRDTLPRSVSSTPSSSSSPPRVGPTNPIASSTRSTSSVNALSGTGTNEGRPFPRFISTCVACSAVTRPAASPVNRSVDTE